MHEICILNYTLLVESNVVYLLDTYMIV